LKEVTSRDRQGNEDEGNLFGVNKMANYLKEFQMWRSHIHRLQEKQELGRP
jgi:hypothetical protein